MRGYIYDFQTLIVMFHLFFIVFIISSVLLNLNLYHGSKKVEIEIWYRAVNWPGRQTFVISEDLFAELEHKLVKTKVYLENNEENIDIWGKEFITS